MYLYSYFCGIKQESFFLLLLYFNRSDNRLTELPVDTHRFIIEENK